MVTFRPHSQHLTGSSVELPIHRFYVSMFSGEVTRPPNISHRDDHIEVKQQLFPLKIKSTIQPTAQTATGANSFMIVIDLNEQD